MAFMGFFSKAVYFYTCLLKPPKMSKYAVLCLLPSVLIICYIEVYHGREKPKKYKYVIVRYSLIKHLNGF